MRNILHLFLVLIGLSSLVACSTQKNTWATRSYHQTKTKYNISNKTNKL